MKDRRVKEKEKRGESKKWEEDWGGGVMGVAAISCNVMVECRAYRGWETCLRASYFHKSFFYSKKFE